MADEKGYADKKEFICVACGKPVMLTKFASAKTAKCDECKTSGAQPKQDIISNIQSKPSAKPSSPSGDTKVCECTKCGREVTVTKFASASKVVCDDCKGVKSSDASDGGSSFLRIDISKLDKASMPSLDEYYVLPTIINNPRLREVKCPSCGQEFMKIIKILDGSDRGLVITYQCSNCFLLLGISEQCEYLMSPQKQGHFFNYRGEDIQATISSIQDTRYKNIIDKLMILLVDNNIPIEGMEIPQYTRPYQKLVPTGYNKEQLEVYIQTIDDAVKLFRDSNRIGANIDKPEGTRYIQISDTLATTMVDRLREIMKIPKNKDLIET